jgi:hypothetical protein
MGLNGGGYTFLSTRYLQWIINEDVQTMFTDKTSFLFRLKTCNSTQPYIVLKQLPQYESINLKLGFNENNGYNYPANWFLGNPYLFFGFIPIINATNNDIQGVWANGNNYTFKNADQNPNSYFVLFANFKETSVRNSSLDSEWPFLNNVLASAKQNPSNRGMPEDYFFFLELHFGGGGCYAQNDWLLEKKGIISVAMGFR